MVLTVYVHHCCGGHSKKSALLLAALMAMADSWSHVSLVVTILHGQHPKHRKALPRPTKQAESEITLVMPNESC